MLIRPPHSFKQTKGKDTKLDLFGFEDVDARHGDNSNSGGDHTDGGSSYKIKYFGFDDMSDSDGGDDDTGSSKQRRRNKKAVVAMETPEIIVEDEPDLCDPPDPFEMLEIQQRASAKEKKKNFERREHKTRAGNSLTHTHRV